MAHFIKPQENGVVFDSLGTCTKVQVNTEEWNHLCQAEFGEGRPCGFGVSTTKWTGDCYKYNIFTKGKSEDHKAQVALRWWNGGGEGWFIFNDDVRNGEINLLLTIAEMPVEERRWDACHFLYKLYDKAVRSTYAETAREYSQAFVDKRLKKRKRNNKITVEIMPK